MQFLVPGRSDSDPRNGLEEELGDDLEASILQVDRPFASGPFGTAAAEQKEERAWITRLTEERPAESVVDAR